MTATSLLRASDSRDDLGYLAMVNERLAHAFQQLLSRQAKFEAKAGPVSQALYTEWRTAQNPFGMLLRYTLGTNDGELVLHIPGYLVSQIVDIEYGGRGQIAPRGAFSPTESRFVERLAEQLLQQVQLATGGAITPRCQLAEMQPDILSFNWPGLCDEILVTGILIECPAVKSATVSCFTDLATAKQIANRSSDVPAASPTTNPAWQAKMRAAAMRVQMPARAVLTRAQLPAAKMLTLSPGDILPILLPAQVPLTVAGYQFARGSIGEANGRAAFKIEHIEGMDHE